MNEERSVVFLIVAHNYLIIIYYDTRTRRRAHAHAAVGAATGTVHGAEH